LEPVSGAIKIGARDCPAKNGHRYWRNRRSHANRGPSSGLSALHLPNRRQGGFYVTHSRVAMRSRTSLSSGVMCPGERCMSNAIKSSWRKELDLRSPRSTRHHSLACNLWLPCRHCRSRRRHRVTGGSHRPALLRNHHGLTRGAYIRVARTSSM